MRLAWLSVSIGGRGSVGLAKSMAVAWLLGAGIAATVSGAAAQTGRAELLVVTTVQTENPTGLSLSLELRAVSADGSSARTVLSGLPDGGWVQFSPDRRSFAFITNTKDLVIVRVDGSGRNALAPSVAAYAWSAGGKRLAYASAGAHSQIYTIGIDGSAPRRLTSSARRRTDRFHPFNTLAWSSDGRRIAFTSQRADWKGRPLAGQLFTINSDGKGQKRLRGLGNFVPEEPAWSPTRQELAVGGVVDAGVLLVRPDRGSVGAVYGTRCCVGVSPTWSPNGTRLAFFGGDASAGYAAGVAQPRRSHATIFKHFAGAVFAPTWSRNGAKLAFVGCNDRDVCWLYVSDRDGHRIARVPDSQVRFVKALAWAP